MLADDVGFSLVFLLASSNDGVPMVPVGERSAVL
jgi:hypothetical protein